MRRKIRQMHISYYREKVDSYPDIRPAIWKVSNRHVGIVSVFSGRNRIESHRVNTKRGQKLLRLKDEKERCSQILFRLESEWIEKYGSPCEKIYICRYGNTANRQLFDSYTERQNTYEFNTSVFYGGRQYRSKLEADFARTMDDYGIPYKYEPEILLFNGERKYPDFIIYLPWLDLLILIEIFGRCDDVNYVKKNNGKHLAYIFSGWLPGHNMISFYYNDKTPYVPEMIMEEIETVALRHYLIISAGSC